MMRTYPKFISETDHITGKSNFKNESPECIAIDKKGGVWVGTSGVGLFKYNPQKDAFEQYLEDCNGHSLANKSTDIMISDSCFQVVTVKLKNRRTIITI